MSWSISEILKAFKKTRSRVLSGFKNSRNKLLPPVVQKLDSAIYRINHYPTDTYYRNQLRYPVDSDLSGG